MHTLRSASFFSGAMGLDLGMERAGIETVMACEFDSAPQNTIRLNRPELPLLGDIWDHSADDIRSIAGTFDVVTGGPPCQSLSTIGARRGFEDSRGSAFLRYIEVIRDLQPTYAVIENVRGLLSMSAGGEYDRKGGAIALVADLLEDAGYEVSFNLYNAANFGVPQTRERVIIIASRAGKVAHLSPTHSDDESFGLPAWRTVRETFAEMPAHTPDFIPFPERRLKFHRMLKPGQNWRNLPAEHQREAMGKALDQGGGKTGFYRRLAWDRPSTTLVTHPAMPATDLCHPGEDRPLSIQEYKRIQQFPDEWEITGSLIRQYRQVGNAVPVGLGEAVGRAIVAHARGESLPIPDGFRFSRYRGTSESDLRR